MAGELVARIWSASRLSPRAFLSVPGDTQTSATRPSKAVTASVAEDLARHIRRAAEKSATEQELLIEVEGALSPVLDGLGIPKHPDYEKTAQRQGRRCVRERHD